jgi:hypothetical protein
VCQRSADTPLKEYRVQCTLLANCSEWFDKALNGEWTEGKDRRLQFPDTDPQIVELFVYYLITGTLPFEIPDLEDGTPACQRLAVRLWVFGNEHLLPKLQNDAMRHLYSSFEEQGVFPDIETIREGFEHSSNASPLYMWLIGQLILGLKARVKHNELMGEDPSPKRTANPAYREYPLDRLYNMIVASQKTTPPGYSVASMQSLEACPGLVTQLATVIVRYMD